MSWEGIGFLLKGTGGKGTETAEQKEKMKCRYRGPLADINARDAQEYGRK